MEHHKSAKRNKTQTIYKHTHIMHSLINLTHKRESRTRKKTARVLLLEGGPSQTYQEKYKKSQ